MAAVRAALGTAKAIAVTPELVDRCITRWQAQDVADATINRRTQLLGQALRHARIGNVPKFTRLAENNARQGTVARESFETLVAALPEHLRDLARFGYHTGWRRGEILGLTSADVNLRRGVLTIGDSKNGDGRVIPLCNEDGTLNAVGEIIERRMAARVVKNAVVPHLWHKRGRPIRHFTKAWRKACKAAGLAELKFHDLRRTFATDAAEAGNDYATIMAWTGHRTLSMFLRYRIKSLTGMQRAASRVASFRETQDAPMVAPITQARTAES
jgi:integrase